MYKLACALLPLAFLTACSANTGAEDATSSSAAITTAPLSNLFVLATDTELTVSWTGTGNFTANLIGPGYASPIIPAVVSGASQSVTFTGLLSCASYSWYVALEGGDVASGQTNTRYAGFTTCPSSETVVADREDLMDGYDHQEDGASYCSIADWNPAYTTWPVGYGWRAYTLSNPVQSYNSVEFGFWHWQDGGNGPTACPESTVQVHRGQLRYDLTASQWNRGITNATLNGTVATDNEGHCSSNGTATPYVTMLSLESWGSDGEAWQGSLWAPVMGAPETSAGLAAEPGPAQYPLVVSGSNVTVNFGVPAGQTVFAGFAAPNDGYGSMGNGRVPSFATDNDSCMSTVSNMALTLTYGPMAPDSPVNCTAALGCGTGATVTCNQSPDTFQLVASDAANANRVIGTASAANGFTMNDPLGSTAETYRVCSLGANGQTACSPVTVTSVTPCPPTPTAIALQNASALWTSQNATGVVTLNRPAPSGGTLVSISTSIASSGSAMALAPSSMTVPAGASSATFPIFVTITSAPVNETIQLTATADGVSVTTYVPFFSGNVVATMTYPADQSSLVELQGTGFVSVYTRTGGGTATLSASNGSAMLEATSVPISAAGFGAASIVGEQVSAATDTITASYEGNTAQVAVQVGSPSTGGVGGHSGGGCRGTDCM